MGSRPRLTSRDRPPSARRLATGRPLSLRAFDASGEPVPIAADWMAKVHHIELAGRGGRSFEHRVLDGKNLAYLTGE